jgi:hypothetical protein
METYKCYCYKVTEPAPKRIKFPKPKAKKVRVIEVIEDYCCPYDEIIFIERD